MFQTKMPESTEMNVLLECGCPNQDKQVCALGMGLVGGSMQIFALLMNAQILPTSMR